MKVLLSAFVCRPDWGSEPGLGWNWARALSRDHDVWVLTSERSRPFVHQAPALPRVRFVYVPGPTIAPVFARTLVWPRYYRWQVRAYRRALALHREVGFDIAHHVSWASWRVPSFLWRLGVPLVWGPLGGGQKIPAGFAPILGRSGRAWEVLRDVSQALSAVDPWVRACLKRSRVVLAANSPTRDHLRRLGRADVGLMLETAAPDLDAFPPARRGGQRPEIEVLWVGGLVPRKALPLLLRAVAALAGHTALRVTVAGDGPERGRWQAEAARLGVAGRVSFLGHLARDEVFALYRRADIFVFTSIRDTSGNALLEAMAAGMPIVAVDWCGASDIVDDECAIKVSPRTIPQTVAGITAALAALAPDPARRRRMGERARERVRAMFTWDRLYQRMSEVYRAAVAGAGSPADRPLASPAATPAPGERLDAHGT